MERKRPSQAPAASLWNVKDVERALRIHYLSDVWGAVSFKELELQPHEEDDKSCRRADMMTFFCKGIHRTCRWSQHRRKETHPNADRIFNSYPIGWRIGYEFKTNALDLQCDLKQKWKQNPLARLTNECYIVLPRGIIKWKWNEPRTSCLNGETFPGYWSTETELPWGMGVIEVYRDERKRWKGSLRAEIKKVSRVNMQPELPIWLTIRMLLSRNQRYSNAPEPASSV